MASETNLQLVQQMILKDLNVDSDVSIKIDKLEKLKVWLANEIRILLDRDFQRLLHILYRIDISEENTKKAFADTDPVKSLVELIIERELQKVATREKYKK